MSKEYLTEKQIYSLQMARWKARTDLGFLCREILPYKDVVTDVHGPVIDTLQKFPVPVGAQFYENDIWTGTTWKYKPLLPIQRLEGTRRVLLLDARGHLKTTINAQAHAIQWILNYPDIAIAIFQSNIDKAELILKEIKNNFQFNEKFRALFPEYCPQKKILDFGTKSEFTTPARGPAIVRRESTIMTFSIQKGTAGLHFDVMKFSDIVEPENVKTPERIANVKEAFYMAENLLVTPSYWIDVEGTRYNFADLYGDLIKFWLEEEKTGKPHEYKIFVRSGLKRLDGMKYQTHFTPETLNEDKFPYALDENGKRITVWPVGADGEPRFTLDRYEAMEEKDPYIFSCTPGYAPVLMASLDEQPICNVKVGDNVVGYTTTNRSHLISTPVLAIGQHNADVYRYHMTDGTFVDCTEDHLWYAGCHAAYKGRPYRAATVNKPLFRVYNPIGVLTSDWFYLTGLFDGEGHVGRSSLNITQSQEANPAVYARIEKLLKELNISYKPHIRKAFTKDSTIHQASTLFSIQPFRKLAVAFARAGCAKIEQLQKQFWAQNKRPTRQALVISRKFLGKMPVYWLETASGNYISQGVASKNCQILNDPRGGIDGQLIFEIGKNKPLKITQELFRKNVRIVRYTVTVDTAETVTRRSNYTAFVVCGWDTSGLCWVREIVHGKFLPADLESKFIYIWKKYKPEVFKVEKTGFVRGLMVGIQRNMDLTGIYLPIEVIDRENQAAKTERIYNTLNPWYSNNWIRFVEPDPTDTDGLAAYSHLITELKTFPLGNSDDILDALADQFQDKDWYGRETVRPSIEREIDLISQRWLQIENPFDPDNIDYLLPSLDYSNSRFGL